MKRKPKAKGATVPIGKPLDTPDEELDLLALVTPEDVADAQATANQRMTKRGKELMAAQKPEEQPPKDGS